MPSAPRVAHRWRTAAGSEEDIQRHLTAFDSALHDMQMAIQYGEENGLMGDDMHLRRKANIPWVQLMDNGYKIAEGIISVRSIPKRHIKGMEMAYRLFSNSRRMPKNVYKWWKTNEKRCHLTQEAAHNWPAKVLGGDELFEIGPFRVHNTIGASGRELDSLKKAIERVNKVSRKNPVPGFTRTLYGDIHVVARLTKSHNAAWYKPGDDSLYVRRTKATGLDEVRAMVHELGHRYWAKFAKPAAKKEWAKHHWRVGQREVEVTLPGVGDTLPIKIKGVEGFPVVKLKEGGTYHYEFEYRGRMRTLTTPVRKIHTFLSSQGKVTNYPTPYASTNEEEHFCEALSLLAMDALDDAHEIPFKAIWE